MGNCLTMYSNRLASKVRADSVMKAFDLPSSFPIEKYLTKQIDYDVHEECIKQADNGAKYRKVNKVEYTLTRQGVDKLSYLSDKCSVKCINDFMTTSLVPLPVLYLFVVVNDDIHKMVCHESHDEYVLVKYGYTNNLQRRMSEHLKTYGTGIFLKYHVYIDPSQLKEAENEARKFFHVTKWHVSHPNYSELALVPKEYMVVVASEYKRIGESYLNKMVDMSSRSSQLKRDLEYSERLLAEKERTIGLAMSFVGKKL